MSIFYSDKYKKFIIKIYTQNRAVYSVERGGIRSNYNVETFSVTLQVK